MLQKTLLYFADPMCSWCWGFSPVVQAIQQTFQDELPLQLVLGGLSPDPTTRTMDEPTKKTIREHWQHVNELSGQTFDFRFFERQDFTYHTEPACRAVVTARRAKPELALPFLELLHRSFYTQNLDITQLPVLSELAGEIGLAPQAFAEAFDSDDARAETQRDFRISHQLQVRGFPTLIAVKDNAGTMITAGYQSWQQTEALIREWLTESSQASTHQNST